MSLFLRPIHLAVLLFGLLLFWGFFAVRDAREAARRSCCGCPLNQLVLAFHNYHDVHGSFPPAYVADENGTPMHSWRVLILPFLDKNDFYDQYDFSEPWNGPHNSALAHKMGTRFWHCPSGPLTDESPLTNYVAIVGDRTAFPGTRSTSMTDFHDGLEETILLVEIANTDIHWMEPRDLNFDEMSFVVNDRSRPSISAPHAAGPAVVFADSITAYRLNASLKPATLQALITIDGGEPVQKPMLIQHHPHHGRQLAE